MRKYKIKNTDFSSQVSPCKTLKNTKTIRGQVMDRKFLQEEIQAISKARNSFSS